MPEFSPPSPDIRIEGDHSSVPVFDSRFMPRRTWDDGRSRFETQPDDLASIPLRIVVHDDPIEIPVPRITPPVTSRPQVSKLVASRLGPVIFEPATTDSLTSPSIPSPTEVNAETLRTTRFERLAHSLGTIAGKAIKKSEEGIERRAQARAAEIDANIPRAIRSTNSTIRALTDKLADLEDQATFHDRGLDETGQSTDEYVGFKGAIKRNQVAGIRADIGSQLMRRRMMTYGTPAKDTSFDVVRLTARVGRGIKGATLRSRQAAGVTFHRSRDIREKASDQRIARLQTRAQTLRNRALTRMHPLIPGVMSANSIANAAQKAKELDEKALGLKVKADSRREKYKPKQPSSPWDPPTAPTP